MMILGSPLRHSDLEPCRAAFQESQPIVEAALKALVDPSRKDQGCISYELFASASVPATFVTIEKWQSQEDLDAHMASAHMADAIKAAGDHFDGFPSIHTLRPLSS
jgi:quinol monooxygenase YgiN